MILNLYCIKDELSAFAAPMPFEEDDQAKRWFFNQVDSNKMMKDNPKDFSIWKVGTFDTENGSIYHAEEKLIERAENFYRKELSNDSKKTTV